jgi:hypothetical protein
MILRPGCIISRDRATMACSMRGSALREGKLAARRHLLVNIDFRCDRKAQVHLVPADGSDEIELNGCQESLALMCHTCGMVVLDLHSTGPDIRTVADDQSEDAPCMACQATIPVGSNKCLCPRCGWSYSVVHASPASRDGVGRDLCDARHESEASKSSLSRRRAC